jgi:4-diphosphocytidyl-2-C-methyl-D-erythritol kinase
LSAERPTPGLDPGGAAGPAVVIQELARAKVNLALHVLGRRADGYHELDSIVAFADVGDRLTVVPASDFAIEALGPFAAALPLPADNIVFAAWRAFAARFKTGGMLPAVKVRLEKNLPVAAGIGGGSADAAATLRALVRLTGLAGIDDELRRLALGLGADVPVCLDQKAARMQGAGERLARLAGFVPLDAVLVNPGIAVATSSVFAALDRFSGAPIDAADPAQWRNDLTAPACSLAPIIGDVLATLARQPGARAARLSGSGATCYAIFADPQAASEAARSLAVRHPQWWVFPTALR